MTDHEINIAIMEATGLSGNFTEDLNAMHEAETILTPQGQTDFADALMHAFMFTVDSTDEDGNACIPEVACNYFGMVHSTARQRAEAFLRTIEKWQESTVTPSQAPEPAGR